jgi:hypothetical protein
MRRFTLLFSLVVLLVGVVPRVAAFSLLGPSTIWMTHRLGYDVNAHIWPVGQGAGVGGPMNIGEEYRFNIPTISYGFSSSFLDYFGQRGVQEVEKAVAIMNGLPSMDRIDINDYPLTSQRMNHRAEALFLLDVRSTALSVMLDEMGLSDPTRWVFTLRNRWTTPNSTNYYVIKRNFDPDTWQHSSWINGQLWTYNQVADILDGSASFVFTEPVDPLALAGFLNAAVAGGVVGNDTLLFGAFWTGLTRDDVGGLHYIYRHNNYNVETAPTNSFAAGIGTPVAGGQTSPWTIPVFSTNAVGTGGIPGTSTNIVDLGLRPGIGKINFVKVTQESQFGAFISNTVSFVDTFITNGVEVTQTLLRPQAAPDILFDAGDLQGADSDTVFVSYAAGSATWPSATANGTTTYGPGTIPPGTLINGVAAPSLVFTFNSVGPTIWNAIIGGVFFVSEENSLGQFFLWGSFDGSTAEPLIYPINTSIEAVEKLVLGNTGTTGNGATSGSLVDVWTPAYLFLVPVTAGTGGTGGGTGTTP